MPKNVIIRNSKTTDIASLETLYPAAFPDEDLLPVVRGLLNEEMPILSLVAISGNDVVGHVAFSLCTIGPRKIPAGLLAPLCVSPGCQKQGVGTALVEDGFRRLREKDIAHVLVLGDPEYYGRFGFLPETDIAPPYPMPEEWRDAWQSVTLHDSEASPHGVLEVPAIWQDPKLWGP
ncbi:MAG: N-acetyltransferase [Roseibium sp.]